MNDSDREWLSRVDEKLNNIWSNTEKQDKKIDLILAHNVEQNGWIMRNTIYRKLMVGIGGTGFVLVMGWLLKLTFGG